MEPNSQNGADSLVSRATLRSLVPIADMTLWRWIKQGLFPQPLVLNRRRYWRLAEIQAFVAQQSRAA